MNDIYISDLEGEEKKNGLSVIIKDVCRLVLYYESDKSKFDVNVYLVSNKEMKKLNKEHRNIDIPTDVLSFEYNIYNHETAATLLGEIIISVEKAEEQAKEYGHSLEREVAFLCLHGMLHLLGYDHENKDDQETMFQKQRSYIEKTENEILDQDDLIKKGIKKARKSLSNSYAPYSNFSVASVLITSENKMYEGVNVENITYGATSCAERNAIYSAVSKGRKDIKMIITASISEDFIYPCGICRQVMVEFLKPWSKIVVTRKDMGYLTYRIDDLLPHYFSEFKGEVKNEL